MGTTPTQVGLVAAGTRRGSSSTNQDRYLVGDHYAAVLDGASAASAMSPCRDGGWYADVLAERLDQLLQVDDRRETADVVARAIADVRDRYELTAESSPTSTVAIATWTDTTVDTYVLGDSTIAVLLRDGTEFVSTDSRLADVAADQRDAYRKQLASGAGYGAEHRGLLRKLQSQQQVARNRACGYWIAGALPEAAHHGVKARTSRSEAHAIVLATDGAAAAIERYGLCPDWRAFSERLKRTSPTATLLDIELCEAGDPNGQRWPRSKPHDDKTVVHVCLDKT